MGHQLLEQASLAVLRFPGFKFVLVVEKQFGQVLSVFAVVFGAAGNEGLAIFLEREIGLMG